jgi:hypothetical protein
MALAVHATMNVANRIARSFVARIFVARIVVARIVVARIVVARIFSSSSAAAGPRALEYRGIGTRPSRQRHPGAHWSGWLPMEATVGSRRSVFARPSFNDRRLEHALRWG